MQSYEVKINVPVEAIFYGICGAFEGGSNYWLDDAEPISIVEHSDKNLVWYGKQSVFENDFSFQLEYDEPESEESATGRKIITPVEIANGLQIMATKEPSHFADFVSEYSADQITYDVFMQCVVFGEVIYG